LIGIKYLFYISNIYKMNIPQHIENVDRHEEVGFHKKNLSKLDSIIANTY
jgi:hypothetical protein